MAASPAVLVGREAELAQLNGLLQAAGSGRSSVLVLEGDPGVGKSALLRSLLESSAGFQVLWAQGLESEVELPYGALGQLLRPLQESLAQLSPPQVDVLRPVFANAGVSIEAAPEQGAPDRFAVGAAVLALLAMAAETGPLLAVIDDAHWVDQPSIEALAFVGHRLLAEGIVLLLSRRTGEGLPALAKLPALAIGGLDSSAASELLALGGAGELSGARIKSLVDASNGNPLALLELPRLLAGHELLGVTALDQPLPIGETLLRAYSASFEQLSEQCRRAVLIAALLDEPDIRSVELALEAADLDLSDLADAEDLGLVSVEPSSISFRHPLVRSAATYSVPPSSRRRAHAAAAASLEGSTASNKKLQHAWHLAMATVGSDEAAASMLEAAAVEAAFLCGFSAASAAYERAAQLSPADQDRRRRLLQAADSALRAGLTGKTEELVAAAGALPNSDFASSLAAAGIKSRVDLAQGRLQEALTGAAQAAEAVALRHPSEAAQLLLDAVTAAAFLGDSESARRMTLRALELSHEDPIATAIGRAALGSILVMRGESTEGAALVLPMVEPLQTMIASDPAALEPTTGIALSFLMTDDFAITEKLLSAIISKAVATGAVTAMPLALTGRSVIQLKRGDWQGSAANGYRALSLAQDAEQVFQVGNSLGMVAVIEANRGNESACRESVAAALEITSRIGSAPIEALTHNTLGLLELSLCNFESAAQALERSREICREYGLLEFGHFQWPSELSETYVRLGRTEDALSVVDELDWHAERTDRPIIKAFAARCRGFAVEANYEQHFDSALEWHQQSERPFELARTQLCYGERLRRDKKRAAARPQLEQAWLSFRSLGAEIWAELARAELEAAGVSVTQEESNSRVALLTPQELQVAMAVAEGASNREAASQLFLSPKTIEYHLSRVFRKLNVTARSQLADALQQTSA